MRIKQLVSGPLSSFAPRKNALSRSERRQHAAKRRPIVARSASEGIAGRPPARCTRENAPHSERGHSDSAQPERDANSITLACATGYDGHQRPVGVRTCKTPGGADGGRATSLPLLRTGDLPLRPIRARLPHAEGVTQQSPGSRRQPRTLGTRRANAGYPERVAQMESQFAELL